MNLPEINIETIGVIKAKVRKLTVKYTVDSDMEILPAGDDDALIKAMAKSIEAEMYEEILFMIPLREAGIFVIQ